jgi:hypothetical protein
MAKSQRVQIMPYGKVVPRPLPPDGEVVERLANHPHAVRIRERKLHDWFTSPVDGDTWSAWGIKADPGPEGLTFDAVNRVSPAPEPDEVGFKRLLHSRHVKLHPGIPDEMGERMAPKHGTVRELELKYEVWAPEVAALAEEALARQWRPALTLRWEEMEPLSSELERAFDQLLTYLIQAQYFCSDVIGPYNGRIHYQFLEVKSYLAYELFDYNLHAGILRKRVLSNGGGMGVQVEGFDAGVLEVCNEASHGFEGEYERDFNAAVFALNVVFNGLVLDVMRLGEAAAQSSFDRDLFRQMVQDEARHVAWGCKRLQYYLAHCPDREGVLARLHAIADRIEPEQVAEHLLNPRVIEPLAVLLGGAVTELERGYGILREFWPQFSQRYLGRLDVIGLPRRDRCLILEEAPF